MKRALTIGFLIAAVVTSVSATGRHERVARFSARTVEMTSPARLGFRHVDIAISEATCMLRGDPECLITVSGQE